jgi:hypothetical protein
MKKVILILSIVTLILSCNKDSNKKAQNSTRKIDENSFYSEIIETIEKYPDNRTFEISLQ